MTARFVALLRGINVGRAKRVAMADLRAVVEGLGYGDVRTLLNSGNVVFTAPRATKESVAAARIRAAVAERCGVDSRVTVLAGDAVAAAVAENPLLDVAADPSRLFVAVLADPADARSRLQPLAARSWTPEALAVGGRVAYLWCPAGQIESPLAAALAKTLGDAVTSRNWATMTKLHALVATGS
ncbi:MAG TPA: DUF1697 domain-containing protein [Gemmatimonadaceae bacterium]|nr:DUF1697 domain-containing protein [Gemmatimonadaceae bacterium]